MVLAVRALDGSFGETRSRDGSRRVLITPRVTAAIDRRRIIAHARQV